MKRRGRWLGRGGALTAVLAGLALGCASFPRNPSIDAVDPEVGYRYANLARGSKNSESTFVILTLSGGGTRAAALSYGVMEKLHATKLADGRTLLDEVDVISSVSGGSFAAAYYAAYGPEKFFTDFRSGVIERNIQGALLRRVLAPWNWPRLMSPKFGRSDLLERYYQRTMFGDATYADLPRSLPFVILNASDMSTGAQFSFTQDQFDAMCSDLSTVKLVRAIISSSAFPGAFTPLTFENYPSDTCSYELPVWAKNALTLEGPADDPGFVPDVDANPTRYGLAQNLASYLQPERRFLHLVDGGISDNLGVRGPLEALTTTDAVWSLMRRINARAIDRVVVLIVDAKPRKQSKRDRKAKPPNLFSVLGAAASRPMANYSRDSVEQMRRAMADYQRTADDLETSAELCDETATEACAESNAGPSCESRVRDACRLAFQLDDGGDLATPELYRIHVRFEAVADPALRKRLEQIPTSLRLPPDTIDLLIETAQQLVEQSTDYGRLIEELGP